MTGAQDSAGAADARRRLLEQRLKGRTRPDAASGNESSGHGPRRGESAERTSTGRPLVTGHALGPAPLSPAQERFWFLHRLDPESPTYNMHEALTVDGPLDVERLERAVNRVVDRHPALRTTIGREDGAPVQIVHAELPISVARHDISNMAPTDREQETARLALADARALFDLRRGPLLRLSVIRESDRRHTLLYAVHHIVSDEQSNDIFWRDLARFYQPDGPPERQPGAENGSTDGDGSAVASYADVARWQRACLDGGDHDGQLEHWRRELADLDDVLRLPADRPAPAAPSGRGGLSTRRFDPALAPRVQAFAAANGVTPFMVFLAAFQVQLHRYDGQGDVCVGTPIANRQRPEVADVVGLFLNTVVMRSRFGPDTSFENLLRSVRDRSIDAFANQDLPFDRLVEELRPWRDPGRHPLFQVMFVHSPTEALSRSLPGLELTPLPVDGGVAKFDLTLFVASDADSIEAGFEYDTDRFDAGTVERMLVHLERLLTSAIDRPNAPIGALELLSDDEQAHLADWASGPAPISTPTHAFLHHLIEDRARSTPDAVAVDRAPASDGGEGPDDRLTYRQLDERAARLAAALRSRGVEPGDRVGLLATRDPVMVVAVLGVLKAGAAWVPIDPDHPPARIHHIIDDAELRLVLSAGSRPDPDLPETTPIAELIDAAAASIPVVQPVWPNAETDPETAPAYVIYTSGSTGVPKGVVVTHANIVHSTTVRSDVYDRPVERFLLLSSFAFDSSMVGLLWTLCQGGTLVLPAADLHLDVRHLRQVIDRRRVTHLLALPSLWQVLLDEGPGRLGSLSTVVVAGEVCHPTLVGDHRRRLPDTELYNEYGPTEGTVWSHVWRSPPDFDEPVVPIGRPLPGTTGHVLDPTLRPVPIGVPGELVLGGPGIAVGYLNRPDLTDRAFVRIPALGEPEARYYRTGDLVRWRTDGQLQFLGRVDHQVKVRGHRIEPGEIEAALLEHPGLESAAVVAETATGDRGEEVRLFGYYVPTAPADAVSPASIRDHLAKSLPAHMVPSVLMPLDAMPLTATGKLDRHRLPRPGPTSGGRSDTASVAPRDPLEEMLAEQWCRLLGLDEVGVHDDFFALGGHSLLALRLFARIEDVTGRKLPLSTLFDTPTIALLADRIRSDDDRSGPSSLVPVKRSGFRRPFFYVSPYQISVIELRVISRFFDEDRPLYGLQPHGLAEGENPHDTIEAMAAHYIDEMRSIQPEGPYLIGGHCTGAWVAYEMARRLEADGETVGYLGLVDMPAPGYRLPDEPRVRRIARRLMHYGRDGRLLYAVAWQMKLRIESRLLLRFGSSESQRVLAVREAHDRAYEAYGDAGLQGGYDGPLHVVRSSDNLVLMPDEGWYRGWERATPEPVTYTDIESTHARLLFDPEAEHLAAAFGDGINRAEQASALV